MKFLCVGHNSSAITVRRVRRLYAAVLGDCGCDQQLKSLLQGLWLSLWVAVPGACMGILRFASESSKAITAQDTWSSLHKFTRAVPPGAHGSHRDLLFAMNF